MKTNLNTFILVREGYYKHITLGIILYRNQLYAHTFEPPYYPPEHNLHNTFNTAIPEGTYRLKFHNSPKFGSRKLYLSDVPRRSGIMLHPGNTLADTKGCILPGLEIKDGKLLHSQMALDQIEQLAAQIIREYKEVFLFVTR